MMKITLKSKKMKRINWWRRALSYIMDLVPVSDSDNKPSIIDEILR